MPKGKKKSGRKSTANIPPQAVNGSGIDISKLKSGQTYEFSVPRTGGFQAVNKLKLLLK